MTKDANKSWRGVGDRTDVFIGPMHSKLGVGVL